MPFCARLIARLLEVVDFPSPACGLGDEDHLHAAIAGDPIEIGSQDAEALGEGCERGIVWLMTAGEPGIQPRPIGRLRQHPEHREAERLAESLVVWSRWSTWSAMTAAHRAECEPNRQRQRRIKAD